VDLSELLFKRMFKLFKGQQLHKNPNSVILKDHLPRLTLIARALSGNPIDILPAENVGGWKGNVFFLPSVSSLFEGKDENFNFLLFRVIFLSKQKELGLNWSDTDKGGGDNHDLSASKAAEAAPVVLAALEEDFPGIRELHQSMYQNILESAKVKKLLPDLSWLYGKWMKSEPIAIGHEINTFLSNSEGAEKEEKPVTEMESKPVEEIITIEVDKEKQEEYMLTHNFEKVETAEEFNGSWRDFDTDDSLQEQYDALQELSLKHTVRVDDMVHSIYKAEMAGTLTIAESKELKEVGFHYTYPEWDGVKQRYKADFCKVYPLLFRTSSNTYASNVINENRVLLNNVKRSFAQYHNHLLRVDRLSQGEDFDLDAVVELLTDIKARSSGNDKVYYSKRKKKKELSLLFLMDLSLSSDSYAAGNKILDVEKMMVTLMGEVMNEYNIDFQVDGFFSKTRNFCTYYTLKHFRDDWAHGKWNIGKVSSQGYTRIGPALRHAARLISKRPSERKWIIILSDGKPNDYDRYEGGYGISDIRKALQELEKDHIHSFAFAIEDRARYYLPQMFGNNHYCIISDPKEMLLSMTKLYARMVKG